MRMVCDTDIAALAAQPDIPYLSDTNIMDVADSLNYGYDDYKALAVVCNRTVHTEASYAAHRVAIRAQSREYLAACVEQAGADTILGAHW